MQGEQLAIILLLLIPVPISLYLLVYIGRRRAPIDIPLALLIATTGIWSCGYAMELYFDSYSAKILAERFEFLGLVMGPTGWFLLGMHVHDNLPKLTRGAYFLLTIVPVMTLLLVFTSGYHNFFWSTKELVEFRGFTLFDNGYGIGFRLHAAYSYTLHLVGTGLVFSAMVTSQKYYLRERIAISVAVLLPWIASMIYVFRLVDYPIDFSPFALAISSLIFVLCVFQYKFGDLIPLARERIVSEMHDAVLMLDEMLRVVDFNRALTELFPKQPVEVGETAADLLYSHPKLLHFLVHQQESTDLIYTGFANRVCRVSSELIDRGRESPARLVILRDLSMDKRVQDTLRLVVEGTSKEAGEDFYRSLTRTLALGLNTKCAILATVDEHSEDRMQTLAFWTGEAHTENKSYTISETPAEILMKQGPRIFSKGVAKKFPRDETLVKYGIESYQGVPIYGHDGGPLGLLAVMDDNPLVIEEKRESLLKIFALRAGAEIERRHNEQRIEASEENYRRIVETTKDGVCLTDGKGIVEFVNEPMTLLLGRNKAKIVGNRFVENFAEGQEIPGEFEVREDAEFNFSFTNFPGDVKYVVVSKTVLRRADGYATGILHIFSDVTEIRLLEDTNKRNEAQLRHAQKLESLGVLVGGVAHDFNNLLMPILGYVDLIKQRTVDDFVVTDYLDRMQLAGGKLADLCNQMLTYSGKGHFVETVIDLNEQVHEMQDLVRASIPRNLSVDYFILNKVPAIRADASQVNQVLMNLLINASESMSQKPSGAIKVTTGVQYLDGSQNSSLHFGDSLRAGNYVYFEVQDEGVGISEEDQARLFEPFYTTELTGRGLGMAVVYGIVKAHLGAVEVTSEVGTGTTIRVYFPPTVDAISSIDTNEASTSSVLLQLDGKILIVDDEPYVRELMRGMIENMGLDVIEAEDGAVGLEAFRMKEAEIKLCVLDLTMPGIGGAELLSHIREISTEVPVLLISGYSQQEVRNRGLDSPNVHFLQKPFTFGQFKSAIREQLGL